MKLLDAIAKADNLRPNTLSDEQKAEWLYRLEGDVAGIQGVEAPKNIWPENAELLMPAPHDDIYVFYLMAMIDHYNNETETYFNDITIFNSTMNSARAWWRRNHRPPESNNWQVM